MSLLENVKNIAYYYIKQHYDKYLLKKKKEALNENEIKDFTSKIFRKKEDSMVKYIKNNINSMQDNVDENELDSLIKDIINDKEYIINRINYEISNYQKNNSVSM
jgi:hypothetical protein